MRKLALAALLVLLALAAAGWVAYQLTPWPRALLIRQAFDRDAVAANDRLAARVPPGLRETLDIAYADAPSARLDLYLPPDGDGPFPLLVWVHGGAWISGSKDMIANYLRLIAAEGFAVAGIDYAIAPGATYPGPVVQTNQALAFLAANAADLRIDADRITLAGDSAGAQIAAQTALTITDPAYAARTGLAPGIGARALRGLVLHCGGHDATNLSLDGAFGGFLRTVLWSYFGHRDFLDDPRLADFSIPPNLHPVMPPMFISAGNADPLLPMSLSVAERAAALGIQVDALFFPEDYAPPLAHEYQFDLDTEAGEEAFRRMIQFLDRTLRAPA
jgi:acetyl esterase/lipase